MNKKLKAWLKERELTTDEFGRLIGVSGSEVRRYIQGTRQPRVEVMRRIIDVTRGNLRADDFLASHAGVHPKQRAADARTAA